MISTYLEYDFGLLQEHFNNLHGKNQSELELLDDITKFMKQKAALEKTYAEGLLKLSSVYGQHCVKIAKVAEAKENGADSVDAASSQNVFQLWSKVLDENEKVANLRLAAAQVCRVCLLSQYVLLYS